MGSEDSSAIVRSEGQFGGRPFIAGTRITVDHLIGYYQVILDDFVVQELLRGFPHLTEAQVRAALEYYRDHPEEIDQALREEREIARAHGQIPT